MLFTTIWNQSILSTARPCSAALHILAVHIDSTLQPVASRCLRQLPVSATGLLAPRNTREKLVNVKHGRSGRHPSTGCVNTTKVVVPLSAVQYLLCIRLSSSSSTQATHYPHRPIQTSPWRLPTRVPSIETRSSEVLRVQLRKQELNYEDQLANLDEESDPVSGSRNSQSTKSSA
jgi:hypothetical protein